MPTAGGGWIDRRRAVGLPAEWDSVPDNDPPLQSWLDPFLAPQALRPDWSFDRSVQRDMAARAYLSVLNRDLLDEVLDRWWDALASTPDEESTTMVLDVTCWVRNKQRQRPGLVKRVLCNGKNGLVLVLLRDALLSAPYASPARQFFFPDQPPVSDRYLHHQAGASEADWRSFFEAASTSIRGPFGLLRVLKELRRSQLIKVLPGYIPPSTKTVAIKASWEGMRFSSDNYLLLDTLLPEDLGRTLVGVVTREVGTVVGQWLDESRQVLLSYPKQQVVYVPYGSSSLSRVTTGFASSWVGALQGLRWLYDTDGSGPYAPEQLLPRPDPARPDAPVADVPGELVTTLENCGVVFGTVVPDVLSVERLRREGPSASIGRVTDLLEQAITETAGDSSASLELIGVLGSCALVPVPSGMVLADGASRVSAKRVVLRSGRGSDLGGWLLSTDAVTKEHDQDGLYARLFGLLMSVFDVPPVPIGSQALRFLEWVWNHQPDAEAVRRTLPRLYRLVLEDVQSGVLPEWGNAREHALVYVASRQWLSVTCKDLYLDDLGEDRLKGLMSGLHLATPGHLGETPDEQRRVAALLGIKLLSSRLTLVLRPEGERSLPPGWLEELHTIVALASAFVRDDDEDAPPAAMPAVGYYARLQKSLLDNGAMTHSWDVRAARDNARILLSGEPREFMADLCRVLLQWTGLAGRRDLDELAPTISQLIVYVGNPEEFAQRVEEIRVQHGMMSPSPAPTPPAPGPTAGLPPTEATSDRQPPSKGGGPAKTTPAEGESSPEPAGNGGEHGQKPGGPSPEQADRSDEPGGEASPDRPGPSGGWTPADRERRLRSLRKQRDELEAKMRELLGAGPLPPEEPEKPPGEGSSSKELASDASYRNAVIDFERAKGRYAEAKETSQPGFDIDSYDKPPEDPSRVLVRRIEVKGYGSAWIDDKTVELSDRQFLDAYNRKADGIAVAKNFDYWLYVVERRDDGTPHVLPIKNPSRRTAKFEFRGGTWRELADEAALE